MDEDNFPELCVMNANKTYSKSIKKLKPTIPNSNNVQKSSTSMRTPYDPGEPLTTKVAVEYLLNGKLKSAVCRYCLKISPALSELDLIMQIAGTGALYKVTIREMIACFYPYKTGQDPNFPEKICQRCLDKAINAYLFTQQCEQSERALLNCLDDMHEKLGKLDLIDGPKKRGRQKLNPNYNKLHAEHKKVMDYAEPLRNMINIQAESLTKEPDWNELECKKCWQVLPNLESLMNHEKKHPKHMWYHCRLCGKSFPKHNQLKKHHHRVHVQGKESSAQVDKTFKCKECGNVTENYKEHMQHMEKHKFKRIMKHVIEKKTDRLCLVCLDKSTDLVDLDSMVCIHGGYPELVGDKRLYTVLASTLPDQKSYKYQELHVPCKANIMTISRKVKKNGNKVQDSPYIAKNTGIQLTLSLPRIVSKDKFKTDDFYYYVFCDPITGHGIFRFDSNINTMNTGTPKIVEITDGEPMDLIETSNLDDNLLINDEEARDVLGKPNTGDKIPDSGKDPVDMLESHTTDCKNKTDLILNYNFEDKMEVPSSEEPKINMFNFSYPILIDTDNNKSMKHDTGTNYTESDVHIALTFNLSTPDKGKKTYDQNMHAKKEILIPNDDIGTIKQKISKSWVFSKAFDKYDSLKCNEAINEIAKSETKKNNCNFCWVFQHLKECEYCKDSTHKAVKVTDKQNMEKDILDHTKENKEKSMKKEIETDSLIDTNVRMHNKTVEFEKDGKGHEIGKSWQCNVCLTNNNTNRSTCNCCESNKYTENGNCKVTFGKNKTFFDTTQPEKHKKEYNFDKETNIPNIGEGTVTTVHSLLIEEEWKMDIKSGNNEDKIEKQIANIKNINTIQSMDVETDTFCYQLDKKVEIKDDEMDVEDIPSIPDIVQNFISSPVKTLTTNIVPYVGHTPGADWMSPSTDTSWRTSSSSSPYVGTNIQFNMGTTPHEKGARKMIRAVRTIPKAFHK